MEIKMLKYILQMQFSLIRNFENLFFNCIAFLIIVGKKRKKNRMRITGKGASQNKIECQRKYYSHSHSPSVPA